MIIEMNDQTFALTLEAAPVVSVVASELVEV
jgi:hypothetical protein